MDTPVFAFPFLYAAQRHSFLDDKAFVKYLPGLPGAPPFDTANTWKKVWGNYQYILSNHDLQNYFGYHAVKLYRDIDFRRCHFPGSRLQCR